jgi:inosine/xanthosine triphosphatase
MRVAVGSGNPVKRDAVAAALPDATVESVSVASGVPEQPWGDDETIEGARNRAERALDAGEYNLGVGLEGGVAVRNGDLFLVMWAAASDGERIEIGGGPRMRLPDDVAARLRDGAELGPVMDDLLDTSGVAENQGAAGVLTGGITNRTEALRTAVAGALGPFVTDYY